LGRDPFVRERGDRAGLESPAHSTTATGHRQSRAPKLLQLEAARRLDDLRSPPGNRLEKLQGDRAGQHSIRVNKQYRVCFRWTEAGPEDVEIVDYH